jgi:hypothetical protein
MGTLVSGTPATVYVPVASTITITPGAGGKVSLSGRTASGDPVTPMEIYSATSVTVSAGSTISLLAEGGAATYTDPAGLDTSIQALVSPDGILLPDSSPIWSQADRGIDYIVSGLTLPASGTIGVASMTAGVAYIGGNRRAIAGQVLPLTASRDNYVDIDINGDVVITTVTLAAAAPALTPNSLRLGKVATDATSVTSRLVTGTDSLGNWLSNSISVPYCRNVFSPATVYTAGDRALAFGTSSTSYDNVNMHSESTQNTRFTVPTAGLYYVMGVVILSSGASSSQWNAKIFKNGASASLGTMSADAATVLTQRAGGIVEAAAGDYFELFLTNTVTVTQAAAAMQVARIA